MRAHVVSVFGPFNSRALVEMDAEDALKMVGDGVADPSPARVIIAATRDVESLRTRDADLADSALAASMIAMAYEIEHPYNSATSKSMCAGKLQDAARELRELAPAEEVKDGVDEIAERRQQRRAGGATTKG